ncbi:MAG: GtrA family protein [Prevotella sp.]|nr:GtrA family protein [Prevotella sp.]MBQ4295782.1 GtrA family protein [Prevotella sp.]
MEWIKTIYGKFRHLILYGIIGSFTSTLDFLVFTALTRLVGINYLVANCISVLVGITTSFCLNRTYNFKVSDKTAQRFGIFLTVGLTGLLMSNVILWVGIEKLHGDETITKLASIVLVVFFQFLFNKFVTFRKSS